MGGRMITLHTFGTPHGHRASIMLEECCLPYRVEQVGFEAGRVTTPGFEHISPLSKFPAITEEEDGTQRHIFGSGAILWYLAEKAGRFLPTTAEARADCQCWLMLVLTDFTPVVIGHFRFNVLAPERIEYAIDLYSEEIARSLSALSRRLEEAEYLAGTDYSIADIAAYPFIDAIFQGDSSLIEQRPGLSRWHKLVSGRPAVPKGMQVPAP